MGVVHGQFRSSIGDFRVPDGFTPRYEAGNTRHMSALPLPLLFGVGGAGPRAGTARSRMTR